MSTTLHRSHFLGRLASQSHALALLIVVISAFAAEFCTAATTEPPAAIDTSVPQPGTDWGSSSRHARRRAVEALPLTCAGPCTGNPGAHHARARGRLNAGLR